MTIQINDTKDFIKRFRSLIDAHSALKESGIDLEDPVFADAVISFLDQFDSPQPQAPSVPLPPPSVSGKQPVAYIARNKITLGTVPDTLHASSYWSNVYMQDKVERSQWQNYEIVGLHPND